MVVEARDRVQGAEMRNIRVALGLTQRAWAAQLGCSKPEVARLESGRPVWQPLVHLARLYGQMYMSAEGFGPPVFTAQTLGRYHIEVTAGATCSWKGLGKCQGEKYRWAAEVTAVEVIEAQACEGHGCEAFVSLVNTLRRGLAKHYQLTQRGGRPKRPVVAASATTGGVPAL